MSACSIRALSPTEKNQFRWLDLQHQYVGVLAAHGILDLLPPDVLPHYPHRALQVAIWRQRQPRSGDLHIIDGIRVTPAEATGQPSTFTPLAEAWGGAVSVAANPLTARRPSLEEARLVYDLAHNLEARAKSMDPPLNPATLGYSA